MAHASKLQEVADGMSALCQKRTWTAPVNWHDLLVHANRGNLLRRSSSAKISPEQSGVRRYAHGVSAYVEELAAREATLLINRYGRVYA